MGSRQKGKCKVDDLYRDTHRRYFNDVAFHTAAQMLFQLAIKEGFTPGELKQIAFCAALLAEEHSRKSVIEAANLNPQSIHERTVK